MCVADPQQQHASNFLSLSQIPHRIRVQGAHCFSCPFFHLFESHVALLGAGDRRPFLFFCLPASPAFASITGNNGCYGLLKHSGDVCRLSKPLIALMLYLHTLALSFVWYADVGRNHPSNWEWPLKGRPQHVPACHRRHIPAPDTGTRQATSLSSPPPVPLQCLPFKPSLPPLLSCPALQTCAHRNVSPYFLRYPHASVQCLEINPAKPVQPSPLSTSNTWNLWSVKEGSKTL